MSPPIISPPLECYAATRTQEGRTQNEDAFLIGRGERPFAAVCDGAGNAEQAARRALRLFEKLFAEVPPAELGNPDRWAGIVRLLDSALLGGGQSTFVSLTYADGAMVGACVGDSRAYRLTRDGDCTILTEGASKFRLGSGNAQAFLIREPAKPGDIFLLLTDGAWTPLNLFLLRRTVMSAAVRHFSDVPQAILDAAGRTGRADDMTAIVLRLAR
jgi:serine/threonine protein phosphatase PrpC